MYCSKIIGNTFIILIISGIYWLLKNQPQFWWIWSSIAAIIIILILSALIPIVILPIFYNNIIGLLQNMNNYLITFHLGDLLRGNDDQFKDLTFGFYTFQFAAWKLVVVA